MTAKHSVTKRAKLILPATVRVSYVQPVSTTKSRCQRFSTKGKRSSNVIHTGLGLLPKIHSKSSSNKEEIRNSSIKLDSGTNSSAQQSNVENNNSRTYSIRQDRCSNSHGKQSSIEETDMNTDDLKTAKKFDRHSCLGISLVVNVLILTITGIVLGVLLSKKPGNIVTAKSNPVLQWSSSGITLVGKSGISGSNSSLFHYPYGLAFDSSDALHIVDFRNHRIQKWITGTTQCVTVAGNANGLSGSSADRLDDPVDILFDSYDNMYISDRRNARVQFWRNGASLGTTVAGGTSNISLFGPSALVSNSNSNGFYIADTYGHRVVSYPSGQIVAGGNGLGNGATNLYSPFGLAYESVLNSFIIPNYDTNNVVRWILGASNRTVILGDRMGTLGTNSTLLNKPVGLTMDPMGNIYVADSDNHRIQFFPAGQSYGITIAGISGVPGNDSTHLYTPYWIILDRQLNLYVSDTLNSRIQKFLRY